MSAKGRAGSSSEPLDDYPTPKWCVDRLLDVWRPTIGGKNICGLGARILEPCAGSGSIIRAVEAHKNYAIWHSWLPVEVNRKYEIALRQLVGGCIVENFLEWAVRDREEIAQGKSLLFDAVITNPPYSLAYEFIQASLGLAHEVAVLVRLGFLASEERCMFMRQHTPSVYVLPNRPRFDPSIRKHQRTGVLYRSTADSADYVWLVFSSTRPHGEVRVLESTPAKVRADEFAASCAAWDASNPEIVAELVAQNEMRKAGVLP